MISMKAELWKLSKLLTLMEKFLICDFMNNFQKYTSGNIIYLKLHHV